MTPLQLFETVLALLAVALVLPMVTVRLPVPPAAALVLGGMLLAVIPAVPSLDLDPDLIMVLFLPPLLLASAYFTVWRDFRAELRPILLLALGAVAFTTLLVGYVTRLVVPELPWAACFALGAIVSPPDAVAAKSILQGLKLPRRIVTILEGESLVNDASGLLLYRFAVAAALTGTFDAGTAAISFLWLTAGGIGLGFALARVMLHFLRRHKNAHEVVLVSFLNSWAAWLIAEAIGASSVLAVVTCGIVTGWGQHEVLTARGRTDSLAVWRFVVTVCESLVFVLIGLSLRGVLERLGGLHEALERAGPLALAVVLTVIVARMLWVFPGTYLPRWLSRQLRERDPAPPPGIPLLIGWAGMRGVVSLAAALALPLSFPGRDLLLFATFAVIAVTVLIQGATLGPLIRMLGIANAKLTAPMSMDALATRAQLAMASLRHLEALEPTAESGGHPHPQLLEEYRRRAHTTARVRDAGEALAETRRDHFAAALVALEVGRHELIRLHRGGEIHDEVLHEVEAELDLEELRLRRLSGDREA
jgi:monovalent cation/hydrogen antiporter